MQQDDYHFFPEVIDKLIADRKIVLEKTIGGENIVFVYRFADTDILITLLIDKKLKELIYMLFQDKLPRTVVKIDKYKLVRLRK